MKISKINFTNSFNNKFNYKKTFNRNNIQADTFEKNINFTSNNENKIVKYSVDWGYENLKLTTKGEFDVYYPRTKKLNILKGNDEHLKDISESLCMYSNKDIVNFTKIYLPFRLGLNETKSMRAYSKIMPYIIEQRIKLSNLYEIKSKLETKSYWITLSRDEENILRFANDEIERIDKKCAQAQNKYLKCEHLKPDDGSDKSWQID